MLILAKKLHQLNFQQLMDVYAEGNEENGEEMWPGLNREQMLLRAVQDAFPQRIYSHVSKKNAPSLAVHKKCGFRQVLDYAKYIDGSVARNAVTLQYR